MAPQGLYRMRSRRPESGLGATHRIQSVTKHRHDRQRGAAWRLRASLDAILEVALNSRRNRTEMVGLHQERTNFEKTSLLSVSPRHDEAGSTKRFMIEATALSYSPSRSAWVAIDACFWVAGSESAKTVASSEAASKEFSGGLTSRSSSDSHQIPREPGNLGRGSGEFSDDRESIRGGTGVPNTRLP